MAVYVVPGPVIAKIKGSQNRSMRFNSTIELDATDSADTDTEGPSMGSLRVHWECEKEAPTPTKNCPCTLGNTSSPVLTIMADDITSIHTRSRIVLVVSERDRRSRASIQLSVV